MQAAIFDMDGLLVDTEPFWQDAELKVFPTVGVPLQRKMCLATIGLRIDEVVAHWYAQYPWTGKSQEQVAQEILEEVAAAVRERGTLLSGAQEAIALARNQGLRTALASSSAKYLIRNVLQTFDLEDEFEMFRSAEDDAYGKPHPAVFLRTAADLGIHPTQCVVLEDSYHGLLAAKAARMRAIAVPEAHSAQDPRFVIADVRLTNLTELTGAHLTGL
ncbi:MAG: hexitol phosphatase HxpB [Bacteroidota bacterium]